MERVTNQLLITLDGIRDDSSGLALRELQSLGEVLSKLSSVLEKYVGHSSGHRTLPSQPEGWKDGPRLLELRRSAPGCLSAQWTLAALPKARTGMGTSEDVAVEVLLKWASGQAKASDALVQNYLSGISDALPEGVLLWLGDSDNPHKIKIQPAVSAGSELVSRDESLISDLHAIGLRSAALLRPGPSAADHGDLLYDERGLPK